MGNQEQPAKKLSIVYIADILRRQSDEGHPLSQKEIARLVNIEYGMALDRKAVKRNLLRLQEAGFPVACREAERQTNGRKEAISLDWYWAHQFSRKEIKCLLDLLYFSHLPAPEVKKLAEKLKFFQSKHFHDRKKFVRNIPSRGKRSLQENTDHVIEIISEAIAQKRKVTFFYDHYEADGKRHHAQYPAGVDRRYMVSPYVFFAAEGRYCLVACSEDSGEITLYQAELISGVEISEEPARPQKSVKGLESGIRPDRHLTEYIYLGAGVPETCTFRVDAEFITKVAEDFGEKAVFLSADASGAVAEISAVPQALAAWSLQYAPHIKIFSPPSLVKTVKEQVAALGRLYEGGV